MVGSVLAGLSDDRHEQAVVGDADNVPERHTERLHQLDPGAVTAGCSETPVAGDQRGIERLGERNIGGIIGREVVPQIPDARQKNIMRVA